MFRFSILSVKSLFWVIYDNNLSVNHLFLVASLVSDSMLENICLFHRQYWIEIQVPTNVVTDKIGTQIMLIIIRECCLLCHWKCLYCFSCKVQEHKTKKEISCINDFFINFYLITYSLSAIQRCTLSFLILYGITSKRLHIKSYRIFRKYLRQIRRVFYKNNRFLHINTVENKYILNVFFSVLIVNYRTASIVFVCVDNFF